jgi:hypothetical protein
LKYLTPILNIPFFELSKLFSLSLYNKIFKLNMNDLQTQRLSLFHCLLIFFYCHYWIIKTSYCPSIFFSNTWRRIFYRTLKRMCLLFFFFFCLDSLQLLFMNNNLIIRVNYSSFTFERGLSPLKGNTNINVSINNSFVHKIKKPLF